jgi:hypothetical protein
VRESIAAGVITFRFLAGKDNPDDILSKHWGYQQVLENTTTHYFLERGYYGSYIQLR